MLERIRSHPWQFATAALGLALAVSLGFHLTGSSSGGVSEDAGPGTSSSTTTVPEVAGSPGTSSPPSTAGRSSDGPGHLAVVVDNAPGAQPQVGVAEAPLLVEYPVEGGLTRFNVFVPDGEPGLIGPVRSLRPVNAALLPALTTAVVSTGGQPFVRQDVEASGLTSVTPELALGFISMGRESPHDVFLDLGVLAEMFVPDATAPGLPSGGGLPAAAGPASVVDLPFEGLSYVYEDGVGYVRHQNDEPFLVLDREGIESLELSHDVLVVLSAAERSAGYQDSNGAPVSTFDVVGGGDLHVFYRGELIEGSWSRAALVDPFVFHDESGNSFGLPDGRVYLAVVPRDSTVSTDG